MIISFVYFFISLNSVFSSEQGNIPNYRKYKDFGAYGKEVFNKFYDYYYNSELLKKIKIDHSVFDFKKIIKDANKEDLEKCFGWSESLKLENKFVKTNLVEFIRYSPLYFQSVIEDINKKKMPKEKMQKVNSSEKINSSKMKKDEVFFEKYLSYRFASFIIGFGLFLPGLFSKKESKIKIPLSLLLAFSGGGAFWIWQQQKMKELKNLKELEESNKQEDPIENEIKENDVPPISQKEVEKYYKETLITEATSKDYLFENDVIKKLVMGSHEIYNKIGREVQEEKENREKELLRQIEEKKNAEEADLENTIKTNLNSKNREALNRELEKIAIVCSDFSTKYGNGLDSIKINETNNKKKFLIKNIFELIHISLKQEFQDVNSDIDFDSKTKIPQCQYIIFFDEKGELNISGVCEKISYKIVVNKEVGLKRDIEKKNNAITRMLFQSGFNYDGFKERGGKESDQNKHFYHLPSICKNDKELNIESINKFFDLILSYKHESIGYNQKFE